MAFHPDLTSRAVPPLPADVVRRLRRVTAVTLASFASLLVAGWCSGVGAGTEALLLVAGTITTLAAVPTAVRVLAHPAPGSAPPSAVRGIVAGITVSLSGVALGTAATIGSLLTGPAPGRDRGTATLLTLLSTTVVGLVTGARMLLRSRPGPTGEGERPGASGTRPDLLDDVATVIARTLPGSGPARGAAWANRGLDRWRWSPRRHRTAFLATTSGGTAVALSAGVALVGMPSGWDPSPPVLAALATVLLALLLTARIARSQPRPRPE